MFRRPGYDTAKKVIQESDTHADNHILCNSEVIGEYKKEIATGDVVDIVFFRDIPPEDMADIEGFLTRNNGR